MATTSITVAIVVGSVAFCVVAAVLACSIRIVEDGTCGVVYRCGRLVRTTELGPGIHAVAPFDRVIRIVTRPQEDTYDIYCPIDGQSVIFKNVIVRNRLRRSAVMTVVGMFNNPSKVERYDEYLIKRVLETAARERFSQTKIPEIPHIDLQALAHDLRDALRCANGDMDTLHHIDPPSPAERLTSKDPKSRVGVEMADTALLAQSRDAGSGLDITEVFIGERPRVPSSLQEMFDAVIIAQTKAAKIEAEKRTNLLKLDAERATNVATAQAACAVAVAEQEARRATETVANEILRLASVAKMDRVLVEQEGQRAVMAVQNDINLAKAKASADAVYLAEMKKNEALADRIRVEATEFTPERVRVKIAEATATNAKWIVSGTDRIVVDGRRMMTMDDP